jgi:hypothetical protein
MKKTLVLIIAFWLVIFTLGFSVDDSEAPAQQVLKIDKTEKITGILTRHKEIKVIQELAACYLGITDENDLPYLDSLGITYVPLFKITGPADRLFLLNLRNPDDLKVLNEYGTAASVEGNNVIFRSSDSRNPREYLPNIFRGIKELGKRVKIVPIPPTPARQEAVRDSRAVNPTISEMVGKVNKTRIESHMQTLQNFVTRDASTNGCKKAGDFIFNTLTGYGLDVDEDSFNFEGYSSRNIIGYLPGKTTPSSMVIIGAHYDSYAEPDSTQSAPGADDNASGTAAVLEAAKIMAGYSFKYSVKFILFSAEEWGLYGSDHYAKEAEKRGEVIIGVINLDMVSYADALPEDLDVIVNTNSKWMGTILETAAQNYSGIDVLTTKDNYYDYSDHYSFWDYGFAAVLCIEDYEDTNPYYHTTKDKLNTVNLNFATEVVKTCLAAAAVMAEPYETVNPTITVTSPNGGETLSVGTSFPITWTTTGTVGNVKIAYTTTGSTGWTTVTSSTSNDGSYNWTVPNTVSTQCRVKISEAADGTPSDTSNAVFSIVSGAVPAIGLNRTQLNYGAIVGSSQTGSQDVWVHNSGNGTLNWKVTDNASWLTCSPTSGTKSGIISISVNPNGLGAGSYAGTISIKDANASNSPQTVTVVLTVKPGSQDEAIFGECSTPQDNSVVRSSFPVTGWVLDDIGIESVRIYREEGNALVFVGDAVFVEGARPDIETAYPDHPLNYKAGWGYMLLSYFLPGGGNGVFKLHAVASDHSGKSVTLGVKTVTVDNANSINPFGTIDTPAQGGTASSSKYINWGWVLTPKPAKIPTNGSTLKVWIDSVEVGQPTYNIYRSDLASLFPGYFNSNGAAGYFSLDTTAYENGVHTIHWSASDSSGNSDGIGSRFFLINNTGSTSRQAAAQQMKNRRGRCITFQALKDIPIDSMPVGVKRGYNAAAPLLTVYPDRKGFHAVRVRESEPMHVHLDEFDNHHPGTEFSGYMIVADALKPLPVGSTLDREKGIFHWLPAPGFLGEYRLVFIKEEEPGLMTRKELIITVIPKYPAAQRQKQNYGSFSYQVGKPTFE